MNRPAIKFTLDVVLWGIAASAAYVFRLPRIEFWSSVFLWYLLLVVIIAMIVERRYDLHRQSWRQVGIIDLSSLFKGTAIATLTITALGFLFQNWLDLPRSVPLVTGVLAFLFMCGVRFLSRFLEEGKRAKRSDVEQRKRVLVVGAGSAGAMIVREMLRHPDAGLQPIGFVDDEPGKLRHRVVGLPVFGQIDELDEVVQRENAEEILIAVPSASGVFVRRVIQLADKAKVRYRIIPGVFEILSGNVNISQIRDVKLEDLLRRPPVKLNTAEIADYLRDQVVLVTGAGGSIGSEIVRQITHFEPSLLILFGRGENSIFSIQQELNRHYPEVKHVDLIGDVRDLSRIIEVFEQFRPSVVFHAAAHKHVPLMEQTPSEAILNNIIGTQNIVECCLKYEVMRLVNVSTDKAVNPTSVMGASKRVAEMVVSAGACRAQSKQAFVSVRFGNVLGSRGSVVPTFMNQIRNGGPLTVTHPEMTRYFMTIPEAARLVLQAGGLAENGKVYVLNMGEPVNISDLAHDVIRLSGAQGIEVKYVGMRPGEKLYEELLTDGEGTTATTHSEIFSAKLAEVQPDFIEREVEKLRGFAHKNDSVKIRQQLGELIPENLFHKKA